MIYDDAAHTYEPLGPKPANQALRRVIIIAGATVFFWSLIIGFGAIFFG